MLTMCFNLQGLTKDLSKHYKEYHTQLMKQAMKRAEQAMDSKIKALIQQNSDLKMELNSVKTDIGVKMRPAPFYTGRRRHSYKACLHGWRWEWQEYSALLLADSHERRV